ncbi:protein SRC2-like [Lolium rigidum]|uniref:protein SRC2-like n=1 Tax=Lolium rigidum TaxID=89674 RepID=UPI001F5D8332|nr:protein SRC2-like [Lolium rigidum]
MVHRVLELTLVSAHSLKDVNLFSRMEVYAIASVFGDPRTRQRTHTDHDGGRHPRWEDKLLFAVPPTAAAASAYLHVLLRTERLFGFDDRDVGEVFVPLADLLDGASGSTTAWRCASYQVQKMQFAERRGMLSISYRLGPVMSPVFRDDPAALGYEVTAPWQYRPPRYAYVPEYQLVYPPSYVGMPPAPEFGAGSGTAAAPAGTKNILKSGSLALGLGSGLLGGGFGGMMFGDMSSLYKSFHDDAGHGVAAVDAGVVAI